MREAIKFARMAKPKNIPKRIDPRSYTDDEKEGIVDHVCNEIAKKRSLYRILEEDEGMPSYAEFMRWRSESEELRELLTRAREDALEAVIEEIIDISDDATGDLTLGYDSKGKPYPKIDGDSVQRAKLRVYAREKAAAMLAPRRFNTQRMDVTSDGKALPAPQLTLVENRVASIIMLARQRADEKAELSSILDIEATPTP